jgi:hypothetical protein
MTSSGTSSSHSTGSACACFSTGQWLINNLSPCIVSGGSGDGPPYYVVSTVAVDDAGQFECPSITTIPPPTPTQSWSTDALTVDCAGQYQLCYTLKAGSSASPQPTDCVVATVCVSVDYAEAGVSQTLPPLAGWGGNGSTCSTQFAETGGYAELSVEGTSTSAVCQNLDNSAGPPLVFDRVTYCPTSCNTDPSGPNCMSCGQGTSGTF